MPILFLIFNNQSFLLLHPEVCQQSTCPYEKQIKLNNDSKKYNQSVVYSIGKVESVLMLNHLYCLAFFIEHSEKNCIPVGK